MYRNSTGIRPSHFEESSFKGDGIIVAVAVLVAVLEDGGMLRPGEFVAAMRKVLSGLDEQTSLSHRHVIERFIELSEIETSGTIRA